MIPNFYKAITQTSPSGANGAVFGPDRTYRYLLWRTWSRYLNPVKWIMLNPSTADGLTDDATIRKCVKFAKAWGYGGIKVVNLFGYRATDPRFLNPLGYAELVGPLNNEYILQTLDGKGPNIAAWGQGGKLWSRSKTVLEICQREKIRLQALKIAKDGVTPYHPLYLKDSTLPFAIDPT